MIIIRIVHTPSDMGSAQEGLERESVILVGRQRWEENLQRIEHFWNELDIEIDGLDLDMTQVRIYQDGLPVGGDLGARIVRETAGKGSRNYRIVQRLMDSGARIEATESPELLMAEYAYIKDIIGAKTDQEKRITMELYEKAKDSLLEKRDAHIASAISSTLKDGETGILFIGANHNVSPRLDKDIEVKLLD